MNRPIFDSDTDTIANCLSIIERGMRRLGIDPYAPVTRAAARTLNDGDMAHERRLASAIQRRGSYELSEHQIARMVAMHLEGGMRQADIARELGCAQGTVAKHLLRLGFRKKARRQTAIAA